MNVPEADTTSPPQSIVEAVCLRCGYSLRGIPADGNCPECGMTVARSLVPGDELRHAPPGWLAGLTWGARLMLASLAGFMALPFAAEQLAVAWPQLLYLLPTVLIALAVVATWLLTRPRPRFGGTADSWRWAMRAIAGILLLQTALLYGGSVSGNLRMVHLSGYLGYAFLPFPLLLFLHLRQLARRVLNPSLAEHSAIIGVGASTALVLMTAMQFGPAERFVYRLGGMVTIAALQATALTFLLWAMVSFVRFAVAFGGAWRASREAWERADMAAVDAALAAHAANRAPGYAVASRA